MVSPDLRVLGASYHSSPVASSNGRVSAGSGRYGGRIGNVRSPFHGTWSTAVQALTTRRRNFHRPSRFTNRSSRVPMRYESVVCECEVEGAIPAEQHGA